jgi:hypothetical protein
VHPLPAVNRSQINSTTRGLQSRSQSMHGEGTFRLRRSKLAGGAASAAAALGDEPRGDERSAGSLQATFRGSRAVGDRPSHRMAPANWVSPTAIDSQEQSSDALSTSPENRSSSNLRGDGDVLH